MSGNQPASGPLAVMIAGWSRGLQPVKHAAFLHALARRFPDMQVVDIEPDRWARLSVALRTFRTDRVKWRGRFNAHPALFEARTEAAGRWLRGAGRNCGTVLQIGVTFDAARVAGGRPVVIYTDYVALLTRDFGREWRQDQPVWQTERRLVQERAALAAARHICVRSRMVADAVIDGHRIAPDRVRVVGAGPNLVASGQKADPPRILFIGAEFLRKGGDIVLDAFRDLSLRFPAARLDVVAPDRFRVEAPGLVWHSRVDQAALCALFGAATVLVMPSRFETWGDVLVEAMTAGAVPVVPDRPPLTEIVEDGVSGLVLPELTARALSDAMLKLVSDPQLTGRLSAGAKAAMADRFTMAAVVDKIALAIRAA